MNMTPYILPSHEKEVIMVTDDDNFSPSSLLSSIKRSQLRRRRCSNPFSIRMAGRQDHYSILDDDEEEFRFSSRSDQLDNAGYKETPILGESYQQNKNTITTNKMSISGGWTASTGLSSEVESADDSFLPHSLADIDAIDNNYDDDDDEIENMRLCSEETLARFDCILGWMDRLDGQKPAKKKSSRRSGGGKYKQRSIIRRWQQHHLHLEKSSYHTAHFVPLDDDDSYTESFYLEDDNDNDSRESRETVETMETEEKEDRPKSIRWSDQVEDIGTNDISGKEGHHSLAIIHSYSEEANVRMRILILLLSPTHRKFEFVYCEFDTDERLTVRDMLAQLPGLAANPILSNHSYSALCWEEQELINMLAIQKYLAVLPEGAILTAVPSGSLPKFAIQQSQDILSNRMLRRTIRKAKLAGKGLRQLQSSQEWAKTNVHKKQSKTSKEKDRNSNRSKAIQVGSSSQMQI